MSMLIITGMSGAGKSGTVDILEDLGYYCVDNVPPRLLTNFAELSGSPNGPVSDIVLVVDSRSRDMFAGYREGLGSLKKLGYSYKTLFLDCEDSVLIHRYKETRRMHPLLSDKITSLDQAIREERGLLDFARECADYVVDTSEVARSQLKDIISQLFAGENAGGMAVSCVSFGFKHGLPQDSDLVFDVRCLPNPFYEPELRDKTGLDEEVREYVLSSEPAKELAPKLLGLLDCLIPMYVREGKSRLVISVGCTGGKHRSVVFSELIAGHLRGKGLATSCYHRHMTLAN